MKKKPIQHTELNYFPYKNGKLYAAGKPVELLASIAGQTPLYVYDRQLITSRVNDLRAILPKKIQLHYAIKANPMPALVDHMAGLVDGLDIASHGEMFSALGSAMDPAEISFAGPGKTEKELAAAIASGIVINVESENELLTINSLGEQLATQPRIALRVNPGFELKASGMKMSGGPKQFGIDAEKIPDLLNRLPAMKVQFEGLHIFSGSQNLKSDALIDAHNKTFELASELLGNTQLDYRFINIGGGFGIPYFPGEQALALQPIADNLHQLLKQYTQFKGKQIILELGRYLVGEAGIYISKIIDKKESRGKTYLISDGGLHHHLANSGNFGQVIRKNYPVAISHNRPASAQPSAQESEQVTIVGPLCTPLDTLADNMELPRAEIGDFVVILQSGAYGRTASPENFLGQPHVKELLL